jgi:hypothetical protein
MDPQPNVADSLPQVYRRVLDAATRLVELGARRDAARLRAAAISAYARTWDGRTHRRLEDLLARAESQVAELEAERRRRLRIA